MELGFGLRGRVANNDFDGVCYLFLGGCWLFVFFIMVKIKHFLFLRGMLGGFCLGFLVRGEGDFRYKYTSF